MSNLTTAQLAELTKRVAARIDEFDGALAIDPLPPGIVRLIFDEIETWMARTDYAGDDESDKGWSIEYDEIGRPRERSPWGDVLLPPHGVNEQSIETKASVVRLYCPCGGEMLPTGMLLTSHPARVSHRCEVCGMETHSFLSYPHVTFKTSDEEAARQAVPVTDEPQGDHTPDDDELVAAATEHQAALDAVAFEDNVGVPPLMVSRMPGISTGMAWNPATETLREYDEKSTAADAPTEPAAPYRDQAPALQTEPVAPAAPRQRTQEVKPPDPDAARDKIAHALAAGSNATLTTVINRPRTLAEVDGTVDDAGKDDAADDVGGKRGRPPKFVVPKRAQVIAQLKQIAMGGVMPKQPAYDMAKPANWPTARDSCIHLEASWRELADEAGLDPYRGL